MRFGIGPMRTLLLALVALATVSASATEITTEHVIAGMNARRALAGLPPLREDTRLSQAAEDRMHDMEDQGYWAHVSPDGRSPFECLRPRGYQFNFAGENLACGFETTEVLMEGWMESKGHRENILSSNYEECGVAIIDGATTGRATGRSIVVIFARPQASAKK